MNIVSRIDFNQLSKWLNSHKKDVSPLQQWKAWKVGLKSGPLDSEDKKKERERTIYSQACKKEKKVKCLSKNKFLIVRAC